MLYRTLIKAALLYTLLHASSLHAQESLQLTFGHGPDTGKLYSTRSFPSLRVQDGKQVILQRSSGTDYRLQASKHSLTWFQVQEVPAAETYIAVTPQVTDDQVTLEIKYSDSAAAEAVYYSSTVSGDLSKWIPLLHFAGAEPEAGGKQYSSSTSSEPLSIRVDRLP